jgi:polyisoprenoid-binding protein YceI
MEWKAHRMSLIRMLVGVAAAVVLLVVAAGAGWWFFIREDNELATESPEIPADLVGNPTSSAGSGEVLTFRIIPDRSEAAYYADEKLARLPLPSTAKGTTNDIEGDFHLTADGFDLHPENESSFTVDLTTLTSDEAMRDRRVHNDALQTAQFPTATFVATGVSGVDTSAPVGSETTFQLTGMLDLHGVEKEVTWDVQARREGNVMTALATVEFAFADFNITPPNIAGFVSVEDTVTLQVQVVAELV